MGSIMVLSCIQKHIYRLVRTLNLFHFLSGFAIFSATNLYAENLRNLLEMSQFANICQQQKDNFPIWDGTKVEQVTLMLKVFSIFWKQFDSAVLIYHMICNFIKHETLYQAKRYVLGLNQWVFSRFGLALRFWYSFSICNTCVTQLHNQQRLEVSNFNPTQGNVNFWTNTSICWPM